MGATSEQETTPKTKQNKTKEISTPDVPIDPDDDFKIKEVVFFGFFKRPSSILCRDSNSQPSDYESPPLTTRPGLPPKIKEVLKQEEAHSTML